MRAIAVAILVVAACGAVMFAISIMIQRRRLIDFRALALLNFGVVYPISGVIHLVSPWDANRGYLDYSNAQIGRAHV